ncbi:MAG: DUF2384 domain-containing protein [Gammaproteobacteria bacterium]|nr:DUF2384 domain-containing protein [Gammaproteobacteria bacterium]
MSTQNHLAISPNYRTRVARARAGIPVAEAVEIMDTWSIPVARFAAILGTSERKWGRLRSAGNGAMLNTVESDRLLRLHDVFDHALSVFDSDEDAVAWFSLPNRALSGDTPLSLMDTDAGVHEVDAVLTRLEFGVFA